MGVLIGQQLSCIPCLFPKVMGKWLLVLCIKLSKIVPAIQHLHIPTSCCGTCMEQYGKFRTEGLESIVWNKVGYLKSVTTVM